MLHAFYGAMGSPSTYARKNKLEGVKPRPTPERSHSISNPTPQIRHGLFPKKGYPNIDLHIPETSSETFSLASRVSKEWSGHAPRHPVGRHEMKLKNLEFRVEGLGFRVILGEYWDNGKEKGNYRVYNRGYIGMVCSSSFPEK